MPAQPNVREYTVSEISGALKRALEDGFGFVRVRGELGRVVRAGSGHVYLDLKDEGAVLSGVMWKGVASRQPIAPEQGMEVIASGKISTFPGQSKYQLIIDSLEPAGAGALMALLEERKKKLAAEGLFDPERKRSLPFLPDVIGVVTSPSGAVIRDILHRLRDRFPCRVIVWPTLVQGRGAEVQIAAAIDGFNALPEGGAVPRPDVLIVARGGGSIEDLWCFNEEVVVRAAARSVIPLISAVGHETDTTLIDYAADRRAPTPSAAAEMAVPVRAELLAETLNKERRLVAAMARMVDGARTALRAARRGLGRPEELVATAVQRLDRAGDRLGAGLAARLSVADAAFARAGSRLRPILLSSSRRVLTERLRMAGGRLDGAPHQRVRLAREAIAGRRLPKTAIEARLADSVARAGGLGDRLRPCAARGIDARRDRLKGIAKLLESLSHKSALARGFALVRTETGALVSSAAAASDAGRVRIAFVDGERLADILAPLSPPVRRKRTKTAGTDAPEAPAATGVQESLFD